MYPIFKGCQKPIFYFELTLTLTIKFGSAASLRENCSYQPCTTFTGTYGPSALFTMSALPAENDKA
ncbi:hypothetical protein T11_7404 [Trichinella zimbabwensis]|uniref:Uncharacterized protein n=1 Tax=Trichinella zimbabwensis TaxID=268475 RepID=A0A0V1HFF2_9BILA|nr:hypothetical protein T11_7404 [Trichinella zimbabwensis]